MLQDLLYQIEILMESVFIWITLKNVKILCFLNYEELVRKKY